MICFRCDNEDAFDIYENANIEQEYKGKILMVKTPVTVCRECGFQTLTLGQLDALLIATEKVYVDEANN